MQTPLPTRGVPADNCGVSLEARKYPHGTKLTAPVNCRDIHRLQPEVRNGFELKAGR